MPGEARAPGLVSRRSFFAPGGGNSELDSRRQQPEPGADPAAGLGGASLGAAPAVLSAAVQGAGGGKRWSQVGRSKTRRPRAPRAEPELLEPEPPHAASGKPATVPAESSRSCRSRRLISVRSGGERLVTPETGSRILLQLGTARLPALALPPQ